MKKGEELENKFSRLERFMVQRREEMYDIVAVLKLAKMVCEVVEGEDERKKDRLLELAEEWYMTYEGWK